MTLPDGVEVITPNPRLQRCTLELSCGMGYALKKYGNDRKKPRNLLKQYMPTYPFLIPEQGALPRPLWSGDWRCAYSLGE